MESTALLSVLDTPLLWVTQERVAWANPAANALFASAPTGRPWQEITQNLPDGYTYRLHPLTATTQAGMLMECIPKASDELWREVQRLAAENRELEQILDSCLDEVFVTDADGRTVRVNEAAAQMYGMTREELIGQSVYELEQAGVFYPSVTSMVLREKKRVSVLQTTRSGRRLMASANPVFDADGNIVQVVTSAKDVTELDLPPLIPHTAQRADAEGAAFGPTITLVAESPRMQSVLKTATRAAATDVTVLILGETGVGKNRLAEYIHAHSRRNGQPFVRVDCASIPENLLESELFGYEPGAFTGAGRRGKPGLVEMADGGTLFLDEIAELPPTVQSKLLQFVQEQSFTRVGGVRPTRVNTRIVAATNRDLRSMVYQGTFRADLYYRLSVLPIAIPPLRERREDASRLFREAVDRYARRFGTSPRTVTRETLRCIESLPWPGNIRQLENVAQRVVLLSDIAVITPHVVRQAMEEPTWETDAQWEIPHPPVSAVRQPAQLPTGQTLKELLEEYERHILAQAATSHASTYAMAKALGISQSSVVRKLRRYGIGGR
ncbi:sigma-54 interaction domain-containing protein [Alicyclobacillus shizuokensis]|uniref:sigma-54 interaction domain-containing protein n=1 Tax=Alicyclobacillus shizuokensis TaxID=392014 RepID=UPI00082E4C61|nr:sigma 54-interacting transcriptional regulator [Alicyclobacillus shizuokensis]MCL6625353.1 sigma 54-interacting transcriptional regulator [Alicyclobacillus shizuokensis]